MITDIVILEWKTIQSTSMSQDDGSETGRGRMCTVFDEASVL